MGAPAVDNWAEQPLGQALARKKAPPATSADSNSNGQANVGEGSSDCNKSSTEIVEWYGHFRNHTFRRGLGRTSSALWRAAVCQAVNSLTTSSLSHQRYAHQSMQ